MAFDRRLMVVIKYAQDSSVNNQMPYSGKVDSIARSLFMTPETLKAKRDDLTKSGGWSEEDFKNAVDRQTDMINTDSKITELATQNALINPYARIRLTGGINSDGTSKLIDKTGQRPWYEIDSNDAIGYSKIPTTARLIEFGKTDERCRTPYQFQPYPQRWRNHFLLRSHRSCTRSSSSFSDSYRPQLWPYPWPERVLLLRQSHARSGKRNGLLWLCKHSVVFYSRRRI